MATIDTNMSLVMIDPNEPLELYDGTIIKGRLEWFLYALCCLDYGNLPTPLSRIEEWANALITNELPNMEPQSRAEEFFKAILTGDTSNLPTPQSRSEVLLDKLARGENDFTNVEKIQSRYEFLLAYLIKNGGGIGNIDYVLYKFQKEDETLYNTKERPVKSAILSGNTLVNIPTTYNRNPSSNGNVMVETTNLSMLKSNTKYLLKIINKSNYDITYYPNASSFIGNDFTVNGKSEGYVILTSLDTTLTHNGIVRLRSSSETIIDLECAILFIEYKDGMENWDIPYFEGMQSVKMPVLTTTGKNLLNTDFELGGLHWTEGYKIDSMTMIRTINPINVSGLNSIYVWSEDLNDCKYIFTYDNNMNFLKRITNNGSQINLDNNITFIHLRTEGTIKSLDHYKNSIVISTSVVVSYEPYKSNILTVNEDVTLRGISDMKDELNLLSGEVTKRINEIVFDGSDDENWIVNNSYAVDGQICYRIKLTDIKSDMVYPPVMSDKLPYILKGYSGNVACTSTYQNDLHVRLNGNTKEDLKRWLSENPLTVQYPLISESIKTVDLTITDQGGATIPKLNTFDKITHVNVSATDILPEVEMEVATTIGEDLSGTLYSSMEDIETKQEALKESNNAQTESVNSTMMATTEIYESLL